MEANNIAFPSTRLFFHNQSALFNKIVFAEWKDDQLRNIAESKANGPVVLGGDAR